jgi:hypothetical protein
LIIEYSAAGRVNTVRRETIDAPVSGDVERCTDSRPAALRRAGLEALEPELVDFVSRLIRRAG